MKGYKKLLVWQLADELAYKVYLASKSFPKEELYGITSQLRRAAISVPTNISESSGRQNPKESRQFLNVALGSLAETEYLLGFSKKIGFLDDSEYQKLDQLRGKLGAYLWNFYRSYS